MLEVVQFPCRSDNFGVLLHDAKTGLTASIDAPELSAIVGVLEARGWALSHIFTTHHHIDHVEANLALKERYNCAITGPAAEADRIPGIDKTVKGGDRFDFAGRRVDVIDCPGHTLGGISLHIASEKLLFAADTLFALGCGRLLEGTPEQMWASLSKLMRLPNDTQVYCGHEYTLSNARFALTIDPDNEALVLRAMEIERLRAAGKPTLPTTIGVEKATNPFLRAGDGHIRERLDMGKATDGEVFAEIRRRKDVF
ncbi:MAG: hydroxyacylglutathione hydrolase [Rhizobiaceae bacterium]